VTRPPPGTTPHEFFDRWLPEAFAGAGAAGQSNAPLVWVTLSGEGGGQWSLRADDDGLHIAALDPRARAGGSGGAAAPDVWLRQSAADFAATFTPHADLPELLPPGWSALDLMFLDPRDVEMMRQISGRIALEIEGKRRRRWTLDVGFGKAGVTAGRPRATVRIDGATYDGLRTGTVPPMQALLSGKVKIEGDRALAMQALMLTAARLSR
jgi:hypothetical protein